MNDPYTQNPPQVWDSPPPPPGQRHGKRGTVIGLLVIAAVIAAIAVGGVLARQSDPDTAAVGDCVSRSGDSSVRVVECTDPDSAFKIVGKVPDKTQIQFSVSSQTICDPFPEAKSAYWKGEQGGTGYVLCLAPVK